jgi:mannan endo-1,4-beta-mannosidase
LVDVNATKETASLFAALRGIGGKNIMFGQQHATTFGLTTGGSKDGTKSDVLNNVGAFPAVFGWEPFMKEKRLPEKLHYPMKKILNFLQKW